MNSGSQSTRPENGARISVRIETIKLTDDVRKAYLRTIYAAKWAENDTHKYLVDYKTLRVNLCDPSK